MMNFVASNSHIYGGGRIYLKTKLASGLGGRTTIGIRIFENLDLGVYAGGLGRFPCRDGGFKKSDPERNQEDSSKKNFKIGSKEFSPLPFSVGMNSFIARIRLEKGE
jgi:hypothetical protein